MNGRFNDLKSFKAKVYNMLMNHVRCANLYPTVVWVTVYEGCFMSGCNEDMYVTHGRSIPLHVPDVTICRVIEDEL
jgi:hypothetical protein